MKRIFMFIMLAFILTVPLYAEDIYSPKDFDTDSIMDSLPNEVKELLPNDIFESDAILSADIGFFSRVIMKFVKAAFKPALEIFSKLLGVMIISSAVNSLKNAVSSDTLSGVFDFVGGLVVMLMVFESVETMFDEVKSYLSILSGVMDSFIPVMTAVCAAGGNLSEATVSSGGLILALDMIEKTAANCLFPILQLCFGLAMASGMGKSLKLGGISKLVRDGMSWVFGLSAAAVSAVMSFQTQIAAKADSLSMRAVRFAASSAIPIAGGIASEAVRTVAGSLSLVKSTVGWAGIVIILLVTLPTLIRVLLTRIGVVFSETVAGILGLEREKSLLCEVSGLLGFLAAICVISSLMFLYSLAVFAKGNAAIGG